MTVQLWDTAGQERFKTITKNYYRNSHGVLVLFDVTNQQSFGCVESWLREIATHASQDISIVLVGNKKDQSNLREVNEQEAMTLANENGLEYFETSAKDGAGIEEAITFLCHKIDSNLLFYTKAQSFILQEKEQKRRTCCKKS